MKIAALFLVVLVTTTASSQRPIDDLPPKVQETLKDPWQRALWDLGGVRSVFDEPTIPPGIDKERAAKEPDWFPQSWDECARLLDLHQPFLNELAIRAVSATTVEDLREGFAYRSAAQLARIAALHAANQKDPRRAAERLATVVDIGRAMMTGGDELASLSGFAILQFATSAIEDELDREETWLVPDHYGPVRSALERLRDAPLRWPTNTDLHDRCDEIADRLLWLSNRVGVDPLLELRDRD